MKRVLSLFASLTLLVTGAAAQGSVQRCESPDGKVTYSNTQCPPGTSPVRRVNTDPPVSVPEQRAAKERAKKEAAEAKKLDQEREKQEAGDERKGAAQAKAEAKADAKAAERCERAERALERARLARSKMDRFAVTVKAIQDSDKEIDLREAEVAKECPR